MNAPVVVFVYNRPEHTKALFSSLELCKEVERHDLFVFSDAAKTEGTEEQVNNVRLFLHDYAKKSSFKNIKIIEAKSNKGLANSIIDGVTEIIMEYSMAIVLEDDLIVSENFLQFMQECLEFYKNDRTVGAISGFSFPITSKKKCPNTVYKSRTGNSWGWATWKDRWESADWNVQDYKQFKTDKDLKNNFEEQQHGICSMLERQMRGEIDSWAVRWDYSFFRRNLWTIYPYKTRVKNDGFDGSGVHCGKKMQKPIDIQEDWEFVMKKTDKCMDLTRKTSGNNFWFAVKDRLRLLFNKKV
jgi:hypothetical protein